MDPSIKVNFYLFKIARRVKIPENKQFVKYSNNKFDTFGPRFKYAKHELALRKNQNFKF